jgi:hypothetical protein
MVVLAVPQEAALVEAQVQVLLRLEQLEAQPPQLTAQQVEQQQDRRAALEQPQRQRPTA